MTRAELLRALQAARESVEQGRRDNLQKGLGINEQREIDALVTESRALVKSMREAYMMGPAGGTCPTCSGSGRI